MKKKFSTIKTYVITHKIISVIVLVVIVLVGYWAYPKTVDGNRYLTANVKKGTIVASISGSGQISSFNQIDLKADVSDTITYVSVKPGDKVTRGKTLFVIDNEDARKSIRDAEINLESAKIAFEKFKIQASDENTNADLAKAYEDGFNTVSNVFLDLPGIMIGFHDIFFKNNPATGQWNIDWYEGYGQVGDKNRDQTRILKQNLTDSYNKAVDSYDANFDNYKVVSRMSDNATIEALISQTYETTKLISDIIKNANNYIDFVNNSIEENNYDTPAIITTHKTSLSEYTSKTNSHLINLLSIKTSIKGYKDAFVNNDLDTQSQLLSLKQKENSLQDLKDKLSDYYVVAPFDGIMASVSAKVGDIASGTLGSIITNQKVATLSMNEVDVAKIKLGQKATITFDAIENLSMTGTVVEIDTIGTVSSGVVTYTVKITFDTDNDQVKPGMSVSAEIITDSKTDTLIVPSSAIKTMGNKKYVLMFTNPLPTLAAGLNGIPSTTTPNQVIVEIGISDDKTTEIISGLKEGDQIVSRTVTTTTKTTTAKSATSLLGGNTRGAPPGM